MKNSIKTLLVAGLLMGTMLSSPVFAQDDGNIPGHPRVNEVDHRENNQQNRIDNGIKDGQLNGNEIRHDENAENRIQNQEKRDMAEHHGHLTKREQRHLNREQNRESRRIHNQRHPGHHAHPGAAGRPGAAAR